MKTEVFNRYEYKYPINLEQYNEILPIILKFMTLDEYNINSRPYTISNIYYDTDDYLLARNSISKPVYKEKLRLRSYGVPEENDYVFVEIKKKFKGLVNKRRVATELKNAYKFLNAHECNNKCQVSSEIAKMILRTEVSPKVYIAYDRIAYFDKSGSDLRVSFDFNIRTRRDNLKLEAGDYGSFLLMPNEVVMEIKSATSMPLWLSELINTNKIRRQSFSKYGTEYKKFISESYEERSKYA